MAKKPLPSDNMSEGEVKEHLTQEREKGNVSERQATRELDAWREDRASKDTKPTPPKP